MKSRNSMRLMTLALTWRRTTAFSTAMDTSQSLGESFNLIIIITASFVSVHTVCMLLASNEN